MTPVWIAFSSLLVILVLYWSTRPYDVYLPCSILTQHVPEHADTEVTVSGLEPGAKIVYWATEPATEGLGRIRDWQRANLENANAGVSMVGESGHAVLAVRKPRDQQVYWRVCKDGGNLGPVQTIPTSLR